MDVREGLVCISDKARRMELEALLGLLALRDPAGYAALEAQAWDFVVENSRLSVKPSNLA